MQPNNRVQELINQLFEVDGKINLEDLAQLVVGETILVVLGTDHRDETYTQFDQDRINAYTRKVVDQIRDHWKF